MDDFDIKNGCSGDNGADGFDQPQNSDELRNDLYSGYTESTEAAESAANEPVTDSAEPLRFSAADNGTQERPYSDYSSETAQSSPYGSNTAQEHPYDGYSQRTAAPANEEKGIFSEQSFAGAAQNVNGAYPPPPPQYGSYGQVPPMYGGYGAPPVPPQYGAPQYQSAQTPPPAPQYVPYGTPNIPNNGQYRQYFPQNTPPPVIPPVSAPENTSPAVPEKKPKTWLMVLIFVILVVGISVVMVVLAMSSKEDSGKVGSGSDNVTVNISVDKRESSDEEDYADKDKGLFTPTGAVKYAMPSIVTLYGYTGTTAFNTSSGSGVIISDDGYIITNAHVVDSLERVSVTLSDERKFEAEIIGFDKNCDLAVLKINAKDLTPAVIGSSSDLKQGETVISIGNSGGFPNTVTIGCVSYANREINSYTGYPVECVQTDAALNSGVSGGALIDLYGRVVGITTSKYLNDDTDNIGFAIATDFAVPLIEDIIENGYVTGRPRIGIMYNFIDSENAQALELKPGLLVREISAECDIAKTDLKVDDIITELDGVQVLTENVVREFQNKHKPGDTVKAKVYRKGTFDEEADKEFEIEFKLEEFNNDD